MKNYFKYILIIFLVILFFGIITKNFYYKNKLNSLYDNPIKMNEKYKDYTYNEYNDHVTILTYDGHAKIVKIPEYINNKPVYALDDSAFYGNTHIEKVVVPSKVIRIGHQTFIGNDNLKEVILPNEIIDIGDHAFDVCYKLEKIYVKRNSTTRKTLKSSPFVKYVRIK